MSPKRAWISHWWILTGVACAGIALTVVGTAFILIDDLGAKIQSRWILLEQQVLKRITSYNEHGRELYEAHCSSCHGVTGGGGRGPNLRDSLLRASWEDRELLHLIRWGIRDRGMPSFDSVLGVRQILQIIGFLRTLNDIPSEPLPGDYRRGEMLFKMRGGCLDCHGLGTEGGSFGPDLTRIGTLRGFDYLREKLVAPQKSVMDFSRSILIQTAAGDSVSGIIVNEDTFSVLVREPSGRLFSFEKSELKTYRVESEKSFMPAYETVFTESELDDLATFLAGQGRY